MIAELHGEGATPSALLGRFKYFQRMSFPGGSNAGVGSRVDYDLSQVLALALAFEVQETAAAPLRVVRLLRHRWPEIERALVATWASTEGFGGEALLLAHSPGALAEMGLADDEDRVPADALEAMSAERVVRWLQEPETGGAPSVYLIDLSRFIRQVAAALLSVAEVPGDDLAERFREMGGSAFGTLDMSKWVVGKVARPTSEGQFREGLNRQE